MGLVETAFCDILGRESRVERSFSVCVWIRLHLLLARPHITPAFTHGELHMLNHYWNRSTLLLDLATSEENSGTQLNPEFLLTQGLNKNREYKKYQGSWLIKPRFLVLWLRVSNFFPLEFWLPPCYEWIVSFPAPAPSNSYVEVLISNTWECNRIWKQGCWRYN